jgi:L-fuconolactonase
LQRDFLPDDLDPILEKHNMDGSIAVQAGASLAENNFLLSLSVRHPKILGVIGWIDFCGTDLEERLEQYGDFKKMMGFRAMVQDALNPTEFLKLKAFNKGVDLFQKHGSRVYELLIKESAMPEALEFCKRHDQGPIVLCHLGKPNLRDPKRSAWNVWFPKLAELEHVSVKISGIVTEADWSKWSQAQLLPYLEKAMECFGSKRIMFGSDWPVCLLAADVNDVYSLAEVAAAALSATEKEMFFGGNAANIYAL